MFMLFIPVFLIAVTVNTRPSTQEVVPYNALEISTLSEAQRETCRSEVHEIEIKYS